MRRSRLLPLLLVATLLGGCSNPADRFADPTQAGRWPASPSAGASTSSGVKVDPAAWKPCPDVYKGIFASPPQNVKYDCATVKVPQDWQNPEGSGTFDVALVRGRSTTQRDRVGSLFINPGGPGARPGSNTRCTARCTCRRRRCAAST